MEIGKAATSASPIVRVHSNCLTGDIFGSMRCECGPQLDAAIDRIARDPEGGYIVYMAGHEGRGIGLWAKAATYLLQDAGENTYQANRSLGLPDDSRDFSDAAYLLSNCVPYLISIELDSAASSAILHATLQDMVSEMERQLSLIHI